MVRFLFAVPLIVALVAAPVAIAADDDTIGSLEEKSVDVRPGKVILDSSELARESYRDFLDLVSTDADLQAEAMRRLGDLELDCAMEGLADGAPVTLAVRPEDVTLQDVSSADENAFEAEIAETEFLGSFLRVDLNVPGLGDRRLRADFSINLVRRQEIRQGNKVFVSLPKDLLRLYPGEAGLG